MGLRDIMKEIYSGMTGDYYKDRAYLLKNKETYKKHELYIAIEQKIDDLLLEIEPSKSKVNSKKKTEDKSEEDKISDINRLYNGALEYIDEKQFSRAKKQMEFIFTKYQNFFDKDKDMFSFADTIEMSLYIGYYKPNNEIFLSKIDNSEFYRTYSNILLEFDDYDEALSAAKNSLRWDPVNVSALIDICEIYYILEDKEKFLENINKAIFFATDKKDLFRCYEYLANYYMENDDYEVAVCLYKLSNSIKGDDKYKKGSDKILQKLEFLEKITLSKYKVKSPKEVIGVLKEKNIAIGPSRFVISTIKAIIISASKNNSNEVEKYCIRVLQRLLS